MVSGPGIHCECVCHHITPSHPPSLLSASPESYKYSGRHLLPTSLCTTTLSVTSVHRAQFSVVARVNKGRSSQNGVWNVRCPSKPGFTALPPLTNPSFDKGHPCRQHTTAFSCLGHLRITHGELTGLRGEKPFLLLYTIQYSSQLQEYSEMSLSLTEGTI